MVRESDILVIGGGIVGLATAWRILESRPSTRLAVVEKEPGLARHQTGRNSGVIHSGIYYEPGSLKAVNCREGKLALEKFCRDEGVDMAMCGKVIVALDASEEERLRALLNRGIRNGVKCEWISRERLRDLEPYAAGTAAIHVPETGIVDYAGVCDRLRARIEAAQGTLTFNAKVTAIAARGSQSVVNTTAGDFSARVVVNCAGLQSDRVTRLAGREPAAKIIPFRGEYFEIAKEKWDLCKNLIYPVPDPAFPFLGVHFTRLVKGGVECGPNAVLAFAREGYKKTDVNIVDLAETLTYGGFLRLAAKHWRMGAAEMWRSWNKAAFTRALQRLVPAIREDDLTPAAAGVRAQAVSADGVMVDDFLFVEDERAVHVNNAPSPAATAALQIGKLVAAKATARIA